MKTTVKKTNTLSDVATIQRNFFPIYEGTTKSGKKCVGLLTDLRLSTDDYKNLMRDILLAGGYGFGKLHAELKNKDGKGTYLGVNATGIDGNTLQSLAANYEWTPAPKKPTKVITHKTDKAAKKQATADIASTIDPEQFKQFLAFQAMLKAGK